MSIQLRHEICSKIWVPVGRHWSEVTVENYWLKILINFEKTLIIFSPAIILAWYLLIVHHGQINWANLIDFVKNPSKDGSSDKFFLKSWEKIPTYFSFNVFFTLTWMKNIRIIFPWYMYLGDLKQTAYLPCLFAIKYHLNLVLAICL